MNMDNFRSPNESEMQKLKGWFVDNYDGEHADISEYYPVGVTDNYTSDSPGYSGKAYVVMGGITNVMLFVETTEKETGLKLMGDTYDH